MPVDLPRVLLAGIAPEVALASTALLLLLVDSFLGDRFGKIHMATMSTIGLALSIWLTLNSWNDLETVPTLQLARMVAVDGFAVFVKITLAVFGLLTVWLSRGYWNKYKLEESEFYALVLFATAGMMLMAGAADLILIFLALETFSIALYVLVGFRRESLESQESAMKYFLLGAFSSAFFLLGIALAYGATGSTNLYSGILEFANSNPASNAGLLVIATGLLIVGLGFKVAAVPFHMWTPDAYQGAPSPVTGFMAAGSKIAAFAALLRLLDASLFSLRTDWRPLVIGIAIATMVVGSVLAVVQDDVKRLLAYSSIAHAGFVFPGIIAANDNGISGALFYLATYGLTVVGAFAVIAVLGGRDEQRVRISDYRGLFDDHPLLAGALTLFLLSLAGVPLTSGFVAKLVVFGAAVEAGYAWLVVVGVVTSAIAAFFYLRVVVAMYMQEREGAAAPVGLGPLASGVIGLSALGTIVLGLYWGPLIEMAEQATFFAGG
jgi:NADH-quinone oxidoreductase subunit N